MKHYSVKSFFLVLLFVFFSANHAARAQEPPAERPPVNVAGKWTIYATGPDGRTSTKHIELKQDGNNLTGHFKGPNQSGGLEGTINYRHIVFRTKTRWVFVFRGRVDCGTTMRGRVHGRNGVGEWQAVRDGASPEPSCNEGNEPMADDDLSTP